MRMDRLEGACTMAARPCENAFSGPCEAGADFSFILAQQANNDLNLWTVTGLWVSNLTDIILMRLTPHSVGAANYVFRALPIDVMPPRIGEEVHGFGYSESSIAIKAPKEFSILHRPITTPRPGHRGS
jgi:hypothetical protein